MSAPALTLIHLCARMGDDFAVHADAAGANEVRGLAVRGHSGGGDELGEAGHWERGLPSGREVLSGASSLPLGMNCGTAGHLT
jgi:hypothetical protein